MLIEKLQLESDETILTQVRKHWFILTLEIVGIAAATLFPVLIVPAIFSVFSKAGVEIFAGVSSSVVVVLGSGWLLLMWMALFNILTNYYLDIWTITNKRLIVVDQRGFFNRNVSSFRLERLQDVSVEVVGIIPTLLNFGTIRAQTAGEDNRDFKAAGLPNPRELKELILNTSGTRTGDAHASTSGKMEI